MPYVYKKTPTPLITEQFKEFLNDPNTFGANAQLNEYLGFTEFFEVYSNNALIGYVWFNNDEFESVNGSDCRVEIFLYKIDPLTSTEKGFVDNVLKDLDSAIKSLLPEDWFNCTKSVWKAVVKDGNDIKVRIEEKLIRYGFEDNFNYGGFTKNV